MFRECYALRESFECSKNIEHFYRLPREQYRLRKTARGLRDAKSSGRFEGIKRCRRLLNARAAEAAAAAFGFVERGNDVPLDILDFLNDKLGDSIARCDFKR